ILDGTAIVDRLGGRTAGVFFVNMNVVFERFVEARLRQCLRGRVRVEGQAISTLDDHRHVAIQPDLVFRDAGRALFVGDAKYKLAEQGIGRQSDYYQLLAYTTAYAVGEGVLIYCRDDGAPPAAEVVVRHSGARLHTRAVYLGSSPKEIDLQLAAIAEWIANRTAAASN
ncbi:MAG: 5-methylcytosine restriction system specificity protein McrC, partial [Ilumatobacteraceae bacterium]